MTMDFPEPIVSELGPAMEALDERRRKFVRAVLELGRDGVRNAKEAARAAGYSESTDGYLRRIASGLLHDARVQAALLEEARRTMNAAAAVVATPIVVEIAMNDHLDARDRLRACEMLFNRGGMPAMTEHKVTVEHRQPKQLEALAARLAEELGVDRQKLIGINRQAAEVLDAEYEEVRREPAVDGG